MIYTTVLDTYAVTDLTAFARSILDDADEATFKATVNLEIGTDVQAYDADLSTIAGLSKTDGNFIVADGADWTVESGATVRTSLGLGTLAVINSPLPIADGGSGQTSQQDAINALTAVSGATIGHVLTKSAGGDAVFAAAAGGSSLPVADTTAIVKGSVDDTKLLRFEVDGFTTGTTRVLTPPDADILLAGQNYANVFSQDQTISKSAPAYVCDATSAGAVALSAGVNAIFNFASSGNFGIASNTKANLLANPASGTTAFTITSAGVTEIIGVNSKLTINPAQNATGDMSAGTRINPDGTNKVLNIITDANGTTAPKVAMVAFTGAAWRSVLEFQNTSGGLPPVLSLVKTAGRVGVGITSPGATMHIDQQSTTGAVPVLALDQADVDEDFIHFIGTSSAATTDRSLIKPSDFPTPGAIVAWLKCKIQDDRVGGIGTIDAWIPAYTTPTV